MAWQTGPLRIIGTVGDFTYCKNGVVRRRRRSDKAHFRNAPSLAPTRQTASEFGRASAAARLLRQALAAPLAGLVSRALCSRLTSQLRAILTLDATHPRGERQTLPAHLSALAGFCCTPAAPLPGALTTAAAVTATPHGHLTLALPAWAPRRIAATPAGATHYQLAAFFVLFDVAAGTTRTILPASPLPPAPIAGGRPLATTFSALATPIAGPTEVLIVALGLAYHQHINGRFYSLPADRLTSLAIIHAGPLS